MAIINLMYHDVYIKNTHESGLASDLYKIDSKIFESQLRLISKYKSEGLDISLTFDDGGSSFYEPIALLLDKYNLKGIFFIATQYIGTEGFLTKEQIRDLDKRGHLIGSHSHTHPENLSILSETEIEWEWKESLFILEKIVGHPINIASIPNGYQSKNIFGPASKAGIDILYTSTPTLTINKHKNTFVYGRYVVLSTTGENGLKRIFDNKRYRILLSVKSSLLSIPKYLLGNKYESFKSAVCK